MEELVELCLSHQDDAQEFLSSVISHLRNTRNGGSSMYDSSAAFEAFIAGGGNVPLYDHVCREVSRLLSSEYAALSREDFFLLDLGCGTGEHLWKALKGFLEVHPLCRVHVHLVDRSQEMLCVAQKRFEELFSSSQSTVSTYCCSFEQLARDDDHDDDDDDHDDARRVLSQRYDVCFSSFALHYCPEQHKAPLLQSLSERCSLFSLFEFDVDDVLLQSKAKEKFGPLVSKFKRGLAEYETSPNKELVLNGFLAPVFCLNFLPDPKADSMSRETSARQWFNVVDDTSFDDVSSNVIFDYWWAPCFHLEARQKLHFDQRPFVDSRLAVKNYGTKGNGFVAVERIEGGGGVLLLSEMPMRVDVTQESSRYAALCRINHVDDPHAYLMENAFRVGNEAHLFLRKSTFNHSCWPNAREAKDVVPGISRVVSMRTIEARQEACICYMGTVIHSWRSAVMLLPLQYRRVHLRRIFGFDCLCERCLGNEAQDVERAMMEAGVEDLPADMPHDVMRLSKEESARFVQSVESRMKGDSYLHLAPLLPAVAVLTMNPVWMKRALDAAKLFLPCGFPLISSMEDLLKCVEEGVR